MLNLFILEILFTFSAHAMTDTGHFIVKGLKYDTEKKYYEVILLNQDGIFKGDDKYFKCMEKSLANKKPAKITYDLANLKITDCEI